jgi:hypothetical protein
MREIQNTKRSRKQSAGSETENAAADSASARGKDAKAVTPAESPEPAAAVVTMATVATPLGMFDPVAHIAAQRAWNNHMMTQCQMNRSIELNARELSSQPKAAAKHFKWTDDQVMMMVDLKLNPQHIAFSRKPGTPGAARFISAMARERDWDQVVIALNDAGVDVSKKQCINKWELLQRQHKTHMLRTRSTGQGSVYNPESELTPQEFAVFQKLDTLFAVYHKPQLGATQVELGLGSVTHSTSSESVPAAAAAAAAESYPAEASGSHCAAAAAASPSRHSASPTTQTTPTSASSHVSKRNSKRKRDENQLSMFSQMLARSIEQQDRQMDMFQQLLMRLVPPAPAAAPRSADAIEIDDSESL